MSDTNVSNQDDVISIAGLFDGDSCAGATSPDGGKPTTDHKAQGTGGPATHEFTMVGVRVLFPVKPYPSQMAVMAQILRGLQKGENCLLESPTGSGKSLALLCSTIAWLRQHNDRVRQYNSLVDQGFRDPELLERLTGLKPPSRPSYGARSTAGGANSHTQTPGPGHSAARASGSSSSPVQPPHAAGATTESSSDGGATPSYSAASSQDLRPHGSEMQRASVHVVDFESELSGGSDLTSASRQPGAAAGHLPAGGAASHAGAGSHDDGILPGGFLREDDAAAAGTDDVEAAAATPALPTAPPAPHFMDDTTHLPGARPGADTPPIRRMRVCQIYFGSRTHKQIAQLVSELKRTAYADTRTVVLGSREHYCIHPTVSKLQGKNEKCKELRSNQQGQSCRYYQNASRVRHHGHLQGLTGITGAHDLEELVQGGHKIHCCPYYMARQLASESAEIVFCPYNYLVDPLIRDAMEISLRGHVVVLDEAHNIEDSSREAASGQFLIDDMIEAMDDIEQTGEKAKKLTQSRTLALFLSILSGWMAKNSRGLEDAFDSAKNSQVFVGTKMIEILNELEIGKAQWVPIKECLTELTEEPEDVMDPPKLKSSTLMLLRNLFLVYHFLFDRRFSDADDYRVSLSKVMAKRKSLTPEKNWWHKTKRRSNTPRVSWTVSLNFICLNPGVAFSEIGRVTRNIILTSGTLSPMTSFQSELGVRFSIQLEANHVIESRQAWVGTVGRGPNNLPLQATYRNTECPQFQDELGCLLISVCRAVPRGVLCFLPSYSLLDKLVSRWQETDVWRGLCEKKEVLTEPRRSEEFEKTINLFYSTIRNTSNDSEGLDGALLLAVCRGKVSEGIDFTDDNARAVVAVGIPFPNFKDVQVTLKREYNSQHHRSRGLLSGSDWYEIQAYRALNQALGRCLRHRYDWGALLLVDVRFQHLDKSGSRPGYVQPQHNRYIRSLSKWVRSMVVHHSTFREALHDMSLFAQRMIKDPPCRTEASPIKNGVRRSSSSMDPSNKSEFTLFVALPSTSGESLARPGPSSSRRHTKPRSGLDVLSGPLTSTQLCNLEQKENLQRSQFLLPVDIQELSQITQDGTDVPRRFLEDSTSSQFEICPPLTSSEMPRSNLFEAFQPVAGPSFNFASELKREQRSVDVGLPDISTPTSKLANLLHIQLRTESPSLPGNKDRKRKLESVPRQSPAKKERLATEQSTTDTPASNSSRPKATFLSSEKIRSTSPVITSGNSTDPIDQQADETPINLSFSDDLPAVPPSPDLFNSSGEQAETLPLIAANNAQNRRHSSSPQPSQNEQNILPLHLRPVKPTVVYLVSDDSDMDDFDLNKSIRRSPELNRRSKASTARKKGVVFSKFYDKS